MKNVTTILSHLTSQPQFRLLKQQTCYKKYITLLSPKWQKAIAFVYIKEETLFIAIKHPGFKMELNYNRDLLKSLLTQLSTYDSECATMRAKKVVIFHSKYHPMPSDKEPLATVPYYDESANGTFILPEDKKLNQLFQRIQNLIQCKA